mgnify:CR=1 FL=1
MNVSLKNIDATKGIVKLEIVKADYADKVEKSLRSFVRKQRCRVSVKGWSQWVW